MAVRILVVDDEPDLELLVRQRFRRQVREGRFEFLFAQNGSEALKKLEQEEDVNLVLSDINMPVMDGLTLLRKLDGIDRLLKAVIVSAYGDMENIRTAMNLGAFDFVTKPIDFQDLETTIDKTLKQIQAVKEAVEARERLDAIRQELSIAARIQLSMLPATFPPFPQRRDIDLFASMTPAREVGGDFYDFFLVDDNRLGFVIGDVSGKGVPAAIYMAVSRTLLRATALQGGSAGDCLRYTNDVLISQSDFAMFVTLFYGILHTRSGEVEYSIAGHNPPYLFADGDARMLDGKPGLLAGVIENTEYATYTVQLRPNQGILLYTDGVTEAIDAAENMFGEERLEASLRRSGGRPAQEIIDGLLDELREFTDCVPQFDDITMLAVRYLG